MNSFFNIDSRIAELGRLAEKACRPQFDEIEAIADYNGQKVLSAFINNRVSEACLKGTTGYGYGDIGRDTLDAVMQKPLAVRTLWCATTSSTVLMRCLLLCLVYSEQVTSLLPLQADLTIHWRK